jgi:peptidyl-prolyl cis-trans isomerase B (cyclophilin B)
VSGVEQMTDDATEEADPVDPTPAAGDPTDPDEQHPHYRARHARRRAKWPWFVAGLVVIAVAAGTTTVLTRRDNDPGGGRVTLGEQTPPPAGVAPAPNNDPGLSTDPQAGTGGSGGEATGAPAVECRYERLSGESAPIMPPDRPTRGGLVIVTIGTNRGPVTLELDAAKAPCTVQSFLTLAGANYFTDSACHRLTTALIFVVQCGDPTATGSGGPGYRFDDENLPAANGYPRGTLAMANAGPNSNGSQFFLVYRDSPIDPNYPVFGRVTGGLEVLDAVAGGGAPNNDGQPNLELVIESIKVS